MATGLATDGSRVGHSLRRPLTETAVVRASGLACALLSALGLARLLGAEEYGRYALTLSWATGLGTVALAGTYQLLLREVAADDEPLRVAALRNFARHQIMVPTFITTGMAIGVGLLLLEPSMLPVMVGIVILFGVLRRQQALLLAHGRTGLAQAGEFIGLPLLQLAIVTPLLWAGVVRHGAALTVTAYVLAMTLVVGVQARGIRSRPPSSGMQLRAAPRREWHRSSRRFSTVNTIVTVQGSVDLWILGALGTKAQVGSYVVATRLATLVAMPLAVMTFGLARETAVVNAAGKFPLLQRQLKAVGRVATATAAAIAGGVLLAGPHLESLLGRSFHDVSAPLLILVTGQLVNVAIGPVATMLFMTGHERDVRNTVLFAAALNVGVSVMLVPLLGAVGAAIGAGASLVSWNLVLHRRVHRRLTVTAAALTPL